jgi:hypothetical protein
MSFSTLLNEVDQGCARSVVLQGPEIQGAFRNELEFPHS